MRLTITIQGIKTREEANGLARVILLEAYKDDPGVINHTTKDDPLECIGYDYKEPFDGGINFDFDPRP